MYKNYVFDLYGTLIDIKTDECSDEFWEKIAILYGYKKAHYTPESLREDYGKYVEQEKTLVRRKHPQYEFVDIKLEKVFKKLFNAKGVKYSNRDIDEICTAFRCCSTEYIRLYDGVEDLLNTLKDNGKRIYLLSNAQRKFTENELNMLGLTPYFDAVIISSDEECSKPDSHYFNILFDRFGLDKKQTVMIGNDYISDIKGAKAVGIDSLYIHQSISPEIKGELLADYKVMDGDVRKIKSLIVK